MMKMKKVFAAGVMVLAFHAAAITSFAATKNQTPTEVEAVKPDEFKPANIDMKKERLEVLVESGRLTQAEADSILKDIEANSANCTGTGNSQGNRGLGFGCGNGGAGRYNSRWR